MKNQLKDLAPVAPVVEVPVTIVAPIMSAADRKRAEDAAEKAAAGARIETAFTRTEAAVQELLSEHPDNALEIAREKCLSSDEAARMSGDEYAQLLGEKFAPEWPTWRPEDVAAEPEPEIQKLMAHFFREKTAYYEGYKAKYAGVGKRPNPRVSWSRFEKYAVAAYNRANAAAAGADTSEQGKAERLTPIAALRRDLPGLYTRVQKGIEKTPNDEKLLKVGTLVHAVLVAILTPLELQALGEKS